MWHHPNDSDKTRVTKTSLTGAGEFIVRKMTFSSTLDPPMRSRLSAPPDAGLTHAEKRKQKPFSRKDGGEAMSKKVLKMPR